jgi:hypothetical protein
MDGPDYEQTYAGERGVLDPMPPIIPEPDAQWVAGAESSTFQLIDLYLLPDGRWRLTVGPTSVVVDDYQMMGLASRVVGI